MQQSVMGRKTVRLRHSNCIYVASVEAVRDLVTDRQTGILLLFEMIDNSIRKQSDNYCKQVD